MDQAVARRFAVKGMACTACEAAVERAASHVGAVVAAKACLADALLEVGYSGEADVEDADRAVVAAVAAAGYEAVPLENPGAGMADKALGARRAATAAKPGRRRRRRARMALDAAISLGTVCGLALLLSLAQTLGVTGVFSAFPTVGTEKLAYPALFGVGLITSVHCIAMCGGLNLGESLLGDGPGTTGDGLRARPAATLRSPALYNAGRLLSYSTLGALLGLLGSAFSVSSGARAAVGVVAGVAMATMGLMLMGTIRPGPVARLLPKSLVRQGGKLVGAMRSHGPFLLGVANGLMPCGPLQAMQLYAVATGDPLRGALSLFAFCLGTAPLMFVTGSAIGALKARWRRVIMRIGGAALVLFGLVAAGNGLALAGVAMPWSSVAANTRGAVVASMEADGVQRATVNVDYGSYQDVQVKTGAPVELTFHVPQGVLNGCNASLTIPAFGVAADLAEGDTAVAFTPTQAGAFPFSCWMGMIKANIIVTED